MKASGPMISQRVTKALSYPALYAMSKPQKVALTKALTNVVEAAIVLRDDGEFTYAQAIVFDDALDELEQALKGCGV